MLATFIPVQKLKSIRTDVKTLQRIIHHLFSRAERIATSHLSTAACVELLNVTKRDDIITTRIEGLASENYRSFSPSHDQSKSGVRTVRHPKIVTRMWPNARHRRWVWVYSIASEKFSIFSKQQQNYDVII